MGVPWLTATDLEHADIMRRAIEAQARVLSALPGGSVETPERTLLITRAGSPERQLMTGVAAWADRDLATVKVTTLTPDNPATGRALIQGIVIAMDLSTGAPALMVEGGALTGLRTGAMAGLAARLLAPPRIDVLAMVGAGVQARWAILALLQELRFGTVRLASRGRAGRDAMADWLCQRLPGETRLELCDTVCDAVYGAAVVCSATSTASVLPVIDASWIGRSALCIALGGAHQDACEIDPAWARHARIFAEDRSEALREAGELRELGGLGEVDVTDLSAVLTGHVLPSFSERRLFRSVGLAAGDLAGVMAVLEAREAVGQLKD